jgi:hypothetical protein
MWSRCWCIVYGNYRFDFNHPNVSLSWSGRPRIRYGNCVLKFSRPDTPASWSGRAKPVMEITCSRRAPVRTIEPSRPDYVLIQERFLRKILSFSCPFGRPWSTVRTAPRQNLPDAHSDPQPINRGSWALRAARIRCEFH